MIPSDRINVHLKQLAKGPLAQDNLLRIAQAIANTLDEEHARLLAVETRMLEVLLILAQKTGNPIDGRWIQDLQDLRGKSRLVDPKGDPVLVELMRLVVGTVQENTMLAEQKKAQQGDPNAKPQQD